MKILIVKTSSLGDVVHTLPAAGMLAAAFPSARIDWLVAGSFAPMAEYCPRLGRVILFDRKKFGSLLHTWRYSLSLIHTLRRERYDLVIDYQGLLKSALFAGFSGGRRIAGFASPRERLAALFYREKIAVDGSAHAVRRNLELTARLTGAAADEIPVPPVNEAHRDRVRKLLEGEGIRLDRPLCALLPGARWESKCFPPSLFVRAAVLAEERCGRMEILVVGGDAERPAAREIVRLLPSAHDLTGKTSIGELVELLRFCSLAVCNDSGPVHIASVLQIPLIEFSGPTNPAKTGPFGRRSAVALSDAPCLGCLKRRCPLPGTPPCFELSDDKIAAALDKALSPTA